MAEESRVVRVAVSSRDGVSVNERFHRAPDDLIFDVDLNSLGREAEEGREAVRFVERRPRPETSDRAQRDFERISEGLADCRVLLSLEFTGAARKALTGKGFAVHQGRGEITRRLREILTQSPPAPGPNGGDSLAAPPSEE